MYVYKLGSNEKELPARPLAQESINEIDSIQEEDNEDQYYIKEEELNRESLTTAATQRRYPHPRKAVAPGVPSPLVHHPLRASSIGTTCHHHRYR